MVRVLPRSPAASAGLRRFDVVVAIGGGGVETAGDAQGRVDESEVGRKVLVTVVRNGREIELGVVPEDLAALREKKKT